MDKAAGSVDLDHNRYGEPFVAPDPQRVEQARALMTQQPYLLDDSRREVVRDAIVALCQEKRWALLAAHVRSNHVHVVVAADRDPGRLMSDLKARASRDLTRAGFESSACKRWTRHGSTLHLFDAASVAQKMHYTLYKQGKPMAIYKGPEPRTQQAVFNCPTP